MYQEMDDERGTRSHCHSVLPFMSTSRIASRTEQPAIMSSNSAQQTQAAQNPSSGVSPLSELDQLVSAQRLLKILWDEDSRPSLQWIRKETKRRMLPFIRRGRLIFYRPRSVIEWFNQKECKPSTMR
jgi:hypothetical protein